MVGRALATDISIVAEMRCTARGSWSARRHRHGTMRLQHPRQAAARCSNWWRPVFNSAVTASSTTPQAAVLLQLGRCTLRAASLPSPTHEQLSFSYIQTLLYTLASLSLLSFTRELLLTLTRVHLDEIKIAFLVFPPVRR